ncbi:MAG: ImuA family protein [Hyphomicrobiaceae bacterium]
MPPVAPAASSTLLPTGSREARLAELRSRIRDLERRSGLSTPRFVAPRRGVQAAGLAKAEDSPDPTRPATLVAGMSSATFPVRASPSRASHRWSAPSWTLGDPALDHILPEHGLALAALHELKPATARDWPATLVLALRLAVRRLAGLALAPARGDPDGPLPQPAAPPLILWCAPSAFIAEHGRLHAPGLARLGLAHGSLLIAETTREAETLWALEEGLRSRAPALVIGMLQEASLTPARRLSLAAGVSGVPCLLLTAPRTAAAAATETRWRVARTASAPHPFDAEAPGALRWTLALERCREAPSLATCPSSVVEWCDVSHRFRLAARLADRPLAAGSPTPRPRAPAVRAG